MVTTDMIFTVKQLKKCQEQNAGLYMTSIDLTKAFDTVSREGLWKMKQDKDWLSSQVRSNGAAVP